LNDLGALISYGFVLGCSVAWPPGPINAEMMRRGLTRGFGSAFAVGAGACTGDALWAVAVGLGAGALVGERARLALGVASTGLMLALAAFFLAGAWRGWRERGQTRSEAQPARGQARRASYFLGLAMALTSPWNFAFWLAVVGRPEIQSFGFSGTLVVAASVVSGAASWCLGFCFITARLGMRLDGAAWNVIAKGVTGCLLLGFAAQGALRLAAF